MTISSSNALPGRLIRATLVTLAFLIYNTGRAQRKIDSLKNEISISTPETRALLAVDLSFEYISINMDSAGLYAEKALAWAAGSGDKATLIKAYMQRGRVGLLTSSYEDGLEYFLKAEELALRSEPVDNEALVRIYSNLGAIYERQQ